MPMLAPEQASVAVMHRSEGASHRSWVFRRGSYQASLFQPLGDGTPCRLGRPALPGGGGHARNEFLQPAHRFSPVFFETAEFLRLDDDHALLADALVAQTEQAVANRLGERGVGDDEAKVHGIGDLVDILPAGPLGADCGQFDFFGGDGVVDSHSSIGRSSGSDDSSFGGGGNRAPAVMKPCSKAV